MARLRAKQPIYEESKPQNEKVIKLNYEGCVETRTRLALVFAGVDFLLLPPFWLLGLCHCSFFLGLVRTPRLSEASKYSSFPAAIDDADTHNSQTTPDAQLPALVLVLVHLYPLSFHLQTLFSSTTLTTLPAPGPPWMLSQN